MHQRLSKHKGYKDRLSLHRPLHGISAYRSVVSCELRSVIKMAYPTLTPVIAIQNPSP